MHVRIYKRTSTHKGIQAAVDIFENSIASAAQRLKQEGENGLILLPGVQNLLQELSVASHPVWSIVTSGVSTNMTMHD